MEKQILVSSSITLNYGAILRAQSKKNLLITTLKQLYSGNMIRKVSFFSMLLLAIIAISGRDLYAQNNSAILDAASPNKGVLFPRVSLSSVRDSTTIASPAVSLMVYNTTSAGVSPNNISPGFYYWDGKRWTTFVFTPVFAEFHALMPPDNAATIAAGAPVNFPQDGPSNGIITRINPNQFTLPIVGTYMVDWQVSVSEAGQLMLQLNGTELAATVVGRAMGTSQIIGHTLIRTTEPNSILSVVNPSGNPAALTITPIAGGTHSVSATLVITRIQ